MYGSWTETVLLWRNFEDLFDFSAKSTFKIILLLNNDKSVKKIHSELIRCLETYFSKEIC